MGNRLIRVSDAEAVGNFGWLLDEVRSGAEVVIEHNDRPLAVLRAVEPAPRTISGCIALAEAHAKELGYEPTLDPDFAADLADIIDNRQPWEPLAWE
jgi:antitoxin (DNA-binding transcriptional repressor) of toxin-antitoxin stability system